MRRTLSLLLMFSFVAAMAMRENIRIMTYNIPYGNILETDGNGKNTWENRAKAIHEYINGIHPDLIGMQEPVRDELCSILSGIPGYAMVGWGRDSGADKGEYTPIIYRTDRFLVMEYGNYWLTDTPDQVSHIEGVMHNRIATWALMVDKQTGAKFLYTNTHLSYESESTKLVQIKYLKTHMLEISNKYGKSLPHFLTGDFNMTRGETNNYTYVQNYQLAMKDMWMNARTKKNLNGGRDDGCIDYIYATKSVLCTYAEWGNKQTEDGYIMSDHHPVWADIYFNTTSEDNARAAINEAWALVDSTYTISTGRAKLISGASMLSADALEPGYNLSSVLDGNVNTFAHSMYSETAPNAPHYLQVKLRSALTDFRFLYERRNDTKFGNADRWQDVMITASNDGETWDYITELYNFGGEALKAYTSDNISLHRPYSYIRFNIMRTPEEKLRNGHPQYSVSEFQMYANTRKADSERYLSPAIDEACTALEALIEETEGYIAAGTVKSANVTALQDAIQAVRDARQEYADGISAPILQMADAGNNDVYDLAGRKITTQGSCPRGIYIKNGKKYIGR